MDKHNYYYIDGTVKDSGKIPLLVYDADVKEYFEMRFDLNYCFLGDVGCGKFSEGSLSMVKKCHHNNSFEINRKPYKDPDSHSEKLYEYHKEIWNKTFPNGEEMSSVEAYNNNHEWKILVLGSDYIGFSKNWIPNNIGVDFIEESLKTTRTFGGHILFPKGFYKGWVLCKKDNKIYYTKDNIYDWYEDKYPQDPNKFNNLIIYTINISKGGEYSFYDRFDWTLQMIKLYYACIKEENDSLQICYYLHKASDMLTKIVTDLKYENVQEVSTMTSRFIKMYYGLDNSRKWFMFFEDFLGFVEYFCLQESFVDKNNQIMKSADWLPLLPTDYTQYMNGTVIQIEKRNEKLNDRLNMLIK
ncbi:hypothetical protein [Proteiniborus sp. MB09-C3]|uniref:DUF6994 family protein n=1 Tax=Proteiniborus sp. MB09-C3 TaxID=3050072 RepID=UPI002556BB99|nr:hypothetical protein [Proteiniborus sp. MB09-C3]WIV13665.1 hypothetical protein QO263_08190 [Proteiniborus sp. MB09-C3]